MRWRRRRLGHGSPGSVEGASRFLGRALLGWLAGVLMPPLAGSAWGWSTALAGGDCTPWTSRSAAGGSAVARWAKAKAKTKRRKARKLEVAKPKLGKDSEEDYPAEEEEDEEEEDEEESSSILAGLQAMDEREEKEAEEFGDVEVLEVFKSRKKRDGFTSALKEEAERLRLDHSMAIDKGGRSGHKTVLLYTSMQFMFPVDLKQPDGTWNGTYVDLTFGRGGHTREMLRRIGPEGRVIAFDVDQTAATVAAELAKLDPRFTFVNRPMSEVAEVLGDVQADAIIMDLGVSSAQLDESFRGFSLSNLDKIATPFDMRMNTNSGLSAKEWLAGASVEEFTYVLQQYGPYNDYGMERVAQDIMDHQKEHGPFETMNSFAMVAAKAMLRLEGKYEEANNFQHPQQGLTHPARLVTQAVRMHLNRESEELQEALPAALQCLKPSGRLILATFKRLENDACRRFWFDHMEPLDGVEERLSNQRLRELYPLAGSNLDYCAKLLTQPLKASGYEISSNKRARSSALWVLEKAPRTLKRVKAEARSLSDRVKEPGPSQFAGGLPDAPRLGVSVKKGGKKKKAAAKPARKAAAKPAKKKAAKAKKAKATDDEEDTTAAKAAAKPAKKATKAKKAKATAAEASEEKVEPAKKKPAKRKSTKKAAKKKEMLPI